MPSIQNGATLSMQLSSIFRYRNGVMKLLRFFRLIGYLYAYLNELPDMLAYTNSLIYLLNFDGNFQILILVAIYLYLGYPPTLSLHILPSGIYFNVSDILEDIPSILCEYNCTIYIVDFNVAYSSRGSVAQAVRRLPSTAGVSSSSLRHSMWVSWWTKQSLGRFFSVFLLFSPTTNFIPPFLHTHLIHFSLLNFISPCDGATDVVSGIIVIH